MPKISVRTDRAFREQVDRRRLRLAALKTLERENVRGRIALTLVVTGDAEIHALNLKYRGVDAPTDVLSFGETAHAPDEPAYLGDVIISYPRAKAQASAGGHATPDELMLLVVHGVLHLLGHAHATSKDKRKMWTAQAHILRELEVSIKIGGR